LPPLLSSVSLLMPDYAGDSTNGWDLENSQH
jgi:hypothetical protein